MPGSEAIDEDSTMTDEPTSDRPSPSSVLEFGGLFAEGAEANNLAPLVLLGLPDDSQSSFRRGPAQGPTALRVAYDGRSYNTSTERGLDLQGRVIDGGDLEPGPTWPETSKRFRLGVEEWLAREKIPFLVGGDHAVTVPAVAGFGPRGLDLHVVQIDAHGDLYPDFEGNPHSHACTGARLLEMDHVASLTQIGVRTLNSPQAELAERHPDRLRIVSAAECGTGGLASILEDLRGKPVYLTLDLDGLDPAFAPGVSHPVPGGLTSRQLLDLFLGAPFSLVGMDLVELNPARDVGELTAILAGRLVHEAMGTALATNAGKILFGRR